MTGMRSCHHVRATMCAACGLGLDEQGVSRTDGPTEVPGPQIATQQPLKFQLVRWTCGNNSFLAYPAILGPAIPHVDPDFEHSVADRLRTLADADLEAAKHGSRIQRAEAKAAARAYRLAADMIEEEA